MERFDEGKELFTNLLSFPGDSYCSQDCAAGRHFTQHQCSSCLPCQWTTRGFLDIAMSLLGPTLLHFLQHIGNKTECALLQFLHRMKFAPSALSDFTFPFTPLLFFSDLVMKTREKLGLLLRLESTTFPLQEKGAHSIPF